MSAVRDDRDEIVAGLRDGRRAFLALVASVRPELHRYAARMVGTLADGEDVVQDALARAYYALSELEAVPALRPWLFRIAHNAALDHLRRGKARAEDAIPDAIDEATSEAFDPEDALAREQSLRAAVSRFVELPPSQRSAVVLKDVLGHSLEEIAELLELSVPAVKAALHRGRAQLEAAGAIEAVAPSRAPSPALARYAALFNARDWDGVRAMLADDVRLDLVARVQRRGRREVGAYVDNYARTDGWLLVPAWLEGREVLAVHRAAGDPAPSYFVEIELAGELVRNIRDFRYVPYIAVDAVFT